MDAPAAQAVEVRADDVTLDARERDLELRGGVHIDAPPFYLTSERLKVQRGPLGVLVEGQGRLGFCRCLGTPLAVSFDGATVAPPGDVLLRAPVLRLYGVPVLAAPLFWLRSAGRAGLLPPDIAYRADDGLLLGVGAHVPWRTGDALHGFDARLGAYVRGGVAAELVVRAPLGTTRVRVDHLDRTGLTVDARGATSISAPESRADGAPPDARAAEGDGAPTRAGALAWDVDAVRGARGVLATTSLDAAARTWDRGALEAAYRGSGAAVAILVRSVSARGGELFDVGAAGPSLRARASGAAGANVVWDATAEGASLSRPGGGPTTLARADGGFGWATHVGPVGVFTTARGATEAGTDGGSPTELAAGGSGTGARRALAGTAGARLSLTLPLARVYASADPGTEWVHRFEPRASAAVLTARGEPLLGLRPGRGAGAVQGDAWVAEIGWTNVLGRIARRTGSEVSASSGLVGAGGLVYPAVRWRAAVETGWLGAGADYARLFTPTFGMVGEVLAARVRVGERDGLHVAGHLTALRDADPTIARLLVDSTLDAASPFLSRTGATLGARLRVPWSREVATSGGADADLLTPTLLAARATVELRDRCDCLVLRAHGSHRVGRPGVDVWITLDVAAP